MARTPDYRSQRELEILRLLAQGETEIEEGNGYDLNAVFAEADALLEPMRQKESTSEASEDPIDPQ